MIKIINPSELIFKEIENDEFLTDLISKINDKLLDLETLPSNGIRFEMYFDNTLKLRQKELLIFIFKLNGWNITINYNGKDLKKEIVSYLFHIIDIH